MQNKLTLGEVIESVSVLEKIKHQDPDNNKIKYWIIRNMKILADSYNFYIQSREDIYAKYCEKKTSDRYPQGSYFEVSDEGNIVFNLKHEMDNQAFSADMNELYYFTCDDIHPYLLSINEFHDKNVQISVNEMLAIDYLLSE